MIFIYALQLLFIALRLMNYIEWRWEFVLSPFIVIGLITLALLGCGILADCIDTVHVNKKQKEEIRYKKIIERL